MKKPTCTLYGGLVRTQANQLVPQLLMKQSGTLSTQYRHTENLHEVWCQKLNY